MTPAKIPTGSTAEVIRALPRIPKKSESEHLAEVPLPINTPGTPSLPFQLPPKKAPYPEVPWEQLPFASMPATAQNVVLETPISTILATSSVNLSVSSLVTPTGKITKAKSPIPASTSATAAVSKMSPILPQLSVIEKLPLISKGPGKSPIPKSASSVLTLHKPASLQPVNPAEGCRPPVPPPPKKAAKTTLSLK